MYEYFHGTLADKSPSCIVIDIGGIGYKLSIPLSLIGKLPSVGERVLLYAAFIVRENAQALYGFSTQGERDLFELLLTLSGIGPKTALALVGHFSMEELEEHVRKGSAQMLAKVPGIGKKTAERLLVDLKGKLKISVTGQSRSSSRIADALSALLNLGYSQAHAESAVKKAAEEIEDESDLSLLITAALKYQR